MGGSATERTGAARTILNFISTSHHFSFTPSGNVCSAECATVGLRIVFNKLEIMPPAYISYRIRISAFTVKMHYHHGPRAVCQCPFYQRVVYLERFDPRFHEHRHKTVGGYCKNGSNVSIGRNNNLVTLIHHSKLYIGPKNECQSIETVGASYAMRRTDIVGIICLESRISVSLQIPSAVYDTTYSVINLSGMPLRDLFQFEIFYHYRYISNENLRELRHPIPSLKEQRP